MHRYPHMIYQARYDQPIDPGNNYRDYKIILGSDLSTSVDHDLSSRTDSLKVTVLMWKTVQFKCRQLSRLDPTR